MLKDKLEAKKLSDLDYLRDKALEEHAEWLVDLKLSNPSSDDSDLDPLYQRGTVAVERKDGTSDKLWVTDQIDAIVLREALHILGPED